MKPAEYRTTRDIIIPAGTRLVHLNGRLVFGSSEVEAGVQFGISAGLDTCTDKGLIHEAQK